MFRRHRNQRHRNQTTAPGDHIGPLRRPGPVRLSAMVPRRLAIRPALWHEPEPSFQGRFGVRGWHGRPSAASLLTRRWRRCFDARQRRSDVGTPGDGRGMLVERSPTLQPPSRISPVLRLGHEGFVNVYARASSRLRTIPPSCVVSPLGFAFSWRGLAGWVSGRGVWRTGAPVPDPA